MRLQITCAAQGHVLWSGTPLEACSSTVSWLLLDVETNGCPRCRSDRLAEEVD